MDNKDFFDEEYDRVEQQDRQQHEQNTRQNSQQFNNWNSYDVKVEQSPRNKKGWLIALICLTVVLSLVMGWVLCSLFRPSGGSSATTDETRILEEVLKVIDNQLYVTDKSQYVDDNGNWDQSVRNAAVAAAGTALLQSLGDRFCRLMSPEQYYTYLYGASSSVVSSPFDGMFGIQFSTVEGLGLYVSTVVTDGASYGRLESDDLVYAITVNSAADAYTEDSIGTQTAMGKALENGNDIVLADYTTAQIEEIMSCLRGGTFHVLRDGKDVAVDVMRGVMPSSATTGNQYNYIEYYFGNDYKNISTTTFDLSPRNAYGEKAYDYRSKVSTYEYRNLNLLPEGVGYVRLTEFSGDSSDNVDSEFEEVMRLFKQSGCSKLVLDLKGNPGGNVVYATNLAGRLTYNFAELNNVTKNGEYLMTTLVNKNGGKSSYYSNYNPSSLLGGGYYDSFTKTHYEDYFDVQLGKSKCNIVVLTDGNSASASELVTGALTDYGVAVQMGTKTYGKGIAQTIKTLDKYTQQVTVREGSSYTSVSVPWAVYYTVDKYYTPADSGYNHNLHGKGLTPTAAYNGLNNYSDIWIAVTNYWK